MKQPVLKITVPEPCTQEWDAMQPVTGGRHCAHCQQTVVDFTRMTDVALLNHVQQNGLGCGRFREEQLGRIISPVPATKQKHWMFRWVAGFLFILGHSKESVAQQKKTVQPTSQKSVTNTSKINCETAAEIEKKPTVNVNDSAILVTDVGQSRPQPLTLGGGIINTVIVIDGVPYYEIDGVLKPWRKTFWQRLQFWKR